MDYGVNHVHSFYRNPIYLIKKIRPKVIFVGDDYEIEDIVGYEECKLWGGKVQIIKRIPGFSSTKIRQNNTWLYLVIIYYEISNNNKII